MTRTPNVVYLPEVFGNIYANRSAFLAVFLFVFFLSYNALAGIGFVPSALRLADVPNYVVPTLPETRSIAVPKGQGEDPVKIEIPELSISASVSNPDTTDVNRLDAALLTGAVRYPGTGVLGEDGNVLIFGHSSHLPVVHNQAYKTFTDIQTLKPGDPIYVDGANERYTYAVASVAHENTATDAIPLSADGAKLTLATCDNFGEKTDRWIVTAELVKVEPKPSE